MHRRNRKNLDRIIQPFLEALRKETDYDLHLMAGAKAGEEVGVYDIQRLVVFG
jgi:hypothetical protein